MWCMNNGVVAITVATAAVAANAAPRTVSKRPKVTSRLVIPLSTVALCWKNSIQGVTVAPISASTIKNVSLSILGMGFQLPNAYRTECQSGCDNRATGTNTRLKAATASVIRSQVQ